MTLLWAYILWVLASAAVALLPMQHSYLPGIALLPAASILIDWLGQSVGWWAAVLALAAFVSKYINPLRYFCARARGITPELSK